MLFHVSMDVRIPLDSDPEKIRQLQTEEHERGRELQVQKKWRHLWRVAGKYSNISIFDVKDPTELHEILNSLPLFPSMEVEVIALCPHPGSLQSEQ